MRYLLLLWVMLASWGASAPDKAVVLGITGEWHLNSLPNHKVAFGDSITASNILTGSQNASILIAWYDPDGSASQSKRFYRKCGEPSCIINLTDPANQPQPAPGVLARAAAALRPYFTHGESAQTFIAAESRGVEGDLDEAVLLLRAGAVDLAPVLKDLQSGTYRLRFEPLTAGAAPGKPFRVEWKPQRAAVAAVPGLQPGLAKIVFLDPGTNQPTNNKAWVLLSTPDEYESRAASFQSMLDATATWPGDLSRPASRPVLRVWLQALADGKAR